jgi:hypothetical protein
MIGDDIEVLESDRTTEHQLSIDGEAADSTVRTDDEVDELPFGGMSLSKSAIEFILDRERKNKPDWTRPDSR